MQHQTFNLTAFTTCPTRGGTCLAGIAFLERLGLSLTLAQRVTGAAPDMDGDITVQNCPAYEDCALQWRAQAGQLELFTPDRTLARGYLGAAVSQ